MTRRRTAWYFHGCPKSMFLRTSEQ